MAAKKISVIGSGNWGSVIAKIIGNNVKKFPMFDNNVNMWVFEEIINGRKLSEIINETHVNEKYLPNHILPSNVTALTDVISAVKGCDILIFVLPHQFLGTTLRKLEGNIKSTAIGLSLIKGFDIVSDDSVHLISDKISNSLGIDCSVLMGANLAHEVADEMFCETTIGCKDKANMSMLKSLIETSYFRVSVVEDKSTVEICGALKNIVACAAGFVDGLGFKDNTKAAVIRLGLMEMIKFGRTFYTDSRMETFFESCGVADLVTTCYGGRNRRVSEAFVNSGKSIDQLEKEMLNGQRLQGPETASEVFRMLNAKAMLEQFPLLVAVHKICTEQIPVREMISCISQHPEHL